MLQAVVNGLPWTQPSWIPDALDPDALDPNALDPTAPCLLELAMG